MKIKHTEIQIPEDNPFSNCKLNRQQYAKVLSEIVENYSDGFVLAINNVWGTGKTTFVKMWQQHLKNAGYKTIYFNAWENDFNSNPLVALMSELKPLTTGRIDEEKVFKSVLEKGAVLTKNILPALTKALIKRYVGDVDDIGTVIENTAKSATEILEDEIKEYSDKKKTILEFRNELEKFVKTIESNKPLIFIIDELDRCRPTYAVEVLEQLKHFFTVNGIVFVLSIDKRHLSSSIKGFYGSNEIDTEEYLRRFIDLEYSIPKPLNKVFCEYLFEYYSFGEFFYSIEKREYPGLQNDGEYLLIMAELLFDKTNPTLRQQEKVFGLTRLILKSFKPNQHTFSHLLFILVYIKIVRNEFYKSIEEMKLTVQELCDDFVDIIPLQIRNEYSFNVMYVVALLLVLYNNAKDKENRIQLVTDDKSENVTTPIKLKYLNSNHNELASMIKSIRNEGKFSEGNLKYLINRINLNESVTMK